jgi:hypothetical protein
MCKTTLHLARHVYQGAFIGPDAPSRRLPPAPPNSRQDFSLTIRKRR